MGIDNIVLTPLVGAESALELWTFAVLFDIRRCGVGVGDSEKTGTLCRSLD